MAELENTETPAVEPEVGTDAYNEAMAAKFDAAQGDEPEVAAAETAEVPAKPEGVPAKFYNKETGEVDYASLTKSYNELEKGRGKTKAKTAEPLKVNTDDAIVLSQVRHDAAKAKADADDATQADKDALTVAEDDLTLAKANAITARKADSEADAAKELVEKSGFDFEELTSEYAANGQLSQDSIDGLVANGIPEATINSYIAGQEALSAQWESEIKNTAGGDQAYADMVGWAKDALTQDEIQAYDTAVNGSDIDSVKLAVTGLRAKYEDEHGREPKLLGGSTGGNPSTQGFSSRAEMVSAMADPRYAKDPSYRKQIENKVGKTTAFQSLSLHQGTTITAPNLILEVKHKQCPTEVGYHCVKFY